jgi:DNA gyrase subunit A
MATKKGIIKKTALEAYSRPRKGGIIAVNLREEDKLVDVLLTDGNQKILLASKRGKAIKFDEKDVRAVGRNSTGVKGMNLKQDDTIVGMVKAIDTKALLTITENGYGKRTNISEYRLIGRGGSGVINIITNERNGNVASILSVKDDVEIMTITKKGIAMRTRATGISLIGRNTQGVRVMRLREGDKVVSTAKIITEKENPEEEIENEEE